MRITSLFLSSVALLTSASGVDAVKKSSPLTTLSSPNTLNKNEDNKCITNLSSRGGAAVTKKKAKKVELNSLDLALAGAVATMIGDAAMHPVDCVKTLQQSTAGAGLSMLGASKQIFSQQGIGGFYSGLGTYVLSDGCAGALKFASYEAMKQWINKNVSEEYYGLAVFICAGAAFVASSVVLVPGELIKQRLQMGQYNTIGSAIKSIWDTKGITGFFTGYSGVCLRDIPYTMMELGLYDNFKNLYIKLKNRKNTDSSSDEKLNQLDEIICAAAVGGITGYFTNPMDMIKTKMMVDGDMYKGFADCAMKTIDKGGIGGLFQGGGARVAWLLPFTAIYLPLYDIFKRRLVEMKEASASEASEVANKMPRGGHMNNMSHHETIPVLKNKGVVTSRSELLKMQMTQSQFEEYEQFMRGEKRPFISF